MRRDALGKIFRIEKKLGRGDLFEVISHFSEGFKKITVYQHEFYDGMGALLKESESWSGAEFKIPLFNLRSPLSAVHLMAALKGLMIDFKSSVTQWKKHNKRAQYSRSHLAWRVFSTADTQGLLNEARKQKVSLNTLLLFHVNKIVVEELIADGEKDCRWLIPVNMRFNEAQCRLHSNHTSSIGLHFTREASLTTLEERYRESLNKWRALFAHGIAHAVSLLGERVLSTLAQSRGERNFWIGSFSNLGAWNFSGIRASDHWPHAISIAPPAGTPCFPVGVGIVTWQGHLSVSLRLHSGLVGPHLDLPERLLDLVCGSLARMLDKSLEASISSKTQPQ